MLAEPGAVEDKEYPDLNLVGSFDVPAEYKSKIYGYENLSRRGEATVPTLDIEYTYLDQPYTHTVEFLDRNDPEGWRRWLSNATTSTVSRWAGRSNPNSASKWWTGRTRSRSTSMTSRSRLR